MLVVTFPRLPTAAVAATALHSATPTQCRVRPNAAHYFATYLDYARVIKLHFEHFDCEGRQMYREAGFCLHKEFTLSGTHYRQTRNYYGRCDD
jgi:hypothetical protein